MWSLPLRAFNLAERQTLHRKQSESPRMTNSLSWGEEGIYQVTMFGYVFPYGRQVAPSEPHPVQSPQLSAEGTL